MKHQDDVDFESSALNPMALQRQLLPVLWQRKGLVLFGIAAGLVLAALYYAQATPVYQSNAQVLVVKKRAPEAVPMSGDPRVSIMEDYLTTHLVLLKSPLVAERAVKKRDLQKLPSLAGSGDPVGVIVSSLGVTREKEAGGSGPSNIINMSYRGTSAEDCGIILAAVIESYKDFLDETYRNFSDDTLELITRGRDLLQKDLREKEKAYREFRENSPLIWKGKDGLTVQQERVASIEARRSALLIRQSDLGDRLKSVETAIAAKRPRSELLALIALHPEAKDKGVTQTDPVETLLLPLLVEEQRLLEEHGPDHPDVVSVRRRITFLREWAKKPASVGSDTELAGDEVDRQVQRLRHELRDAETEYKSLTTLLDAEVKEGKRFVTYENQDEDYRNEIARSQELYKGIIKRLQEINLVRDAGGFDARPIARPGPGRKVAPSLLQVLLGGLAAGLLLGVGLAYLAELSDKGFRTADEIRRRLGLTVIGHIPVLTGDPAAQRKVKSGEATLDPFLCTCHRPKSVESEAYRAVRTALYFSTQGVGHKVIQVTSPDMGDGKSTLVTNLAVCIAQSGKKVIVIDADLRRPRLHRMFGLPAACGLAGVIAGQVEWRELVQPTTIPNLFILPCGPLPPNPAELLTSPRFQEVLAAVREEYDIVLVDTPPVLAVTDPCVVAPRVDGVILTIRLSKKSGPQAERALEMLTSLGVKILGVVVNGVTARGGSGRYGGGQYEYGYSQNEYTNRTDTEESYYEESGVDRGRKNESAGASTSQPAARPREAPSHVRSSGMLSWLRSLWM